MKIVIWALAVPAAAVAGIAKPNLDDIRRYQRMHRMCRGGAAAHAASETAAALPPHRQFAAALALCGCSQVGAERSSPCRAFISSCSASWLSEVCKTVPP